MFLFHSKQDFSKPLSLLYNSLRLKKIYKTNQRDCYENKSDNFTIQKNTGFYKKIFAALKFTSNQIVKKIFLK